MNILNTINKPYNIFDDVNYIEYGALQQFVDVMNHPSITRGALMPDCHQGYTLPIGGVVESKGMVFPSFVGYDIGCGVCALPLSIHVSDVRHKAKKIQKQIMRNIPVGFNKHKKAVEEVQSVQSFKELAFPSLTSVMSNIYNEKKGHLQLGTLGGGKMTASSPRV